MRRREYSIPIILFVVTLFTTTAAGMLMMNPDKISWLNFTRGFAFSLPLLLILGSHELGHFFAARSHKISATLPHFIPFPSLIGTFGAIIKIKSPILDRRALLDVGLAGPLVGFAFALPITTVGLSLSKIVPAAYTARYGIKLGDSLLLLLLTHLAGRVAPVGFDLMLHPMGFAGWIGLWVTSINLIPIGQLDGGHILYALLGEKQERYSWAFFILLIILGLFWVGWFIWALLIYFVVRIKHPTPLYPSIQLDRKRKIAGVIAILIFALTFTPVPFK